MVVVEIIGAVLIVWWYHERCPSSNGYVCGQDGQAARHRYDCDGRSPNSQEVIPSTTQRKRPVRAFFIMLPIVAAVLTLVPMPPVVDTRVPSTKQ